MIGFPAPHAAALDDHLYALQPSIPHLTRSVDLIGQTGRDIHSVRIEGFEDNSCFTVQPALLQHSAVRRDMPFSFEFMPRVRSRRCRVR